MHNGLITNLSFWERESLLSYNLIIVGSGLVGLSAAASYAERYPHARILVLERGLLPTGASTRNAGFACFGSLTEMLADLDRMSPEDLLKIISRRWQGLAVLRKRLGDKAIGFENNGGYELIFAEQEEKLAALDYINQLLHPIFQQSVFSLRPSLIHSFQFQAGRVKNIVVNPLEGQIHTGKMMCSLEEYVRRRNVKIMTGAEVLSFQDDGNQVEIKVKNPLGKQSITFFSKKLALCTNAFTPQLLPNVDIMPGRGQVLVTKSMRGLPFKGIFHYDEGYFYFRNLGGRVLMGGGRNKALKEETTAEFGLNDALQNQLQHDLTTIILPGRKFKIDMQWSGIMAFGRERMPIIEKISPNIATAVRMNGMGIAIGSLAGAEVVTLLKVEANRIHPEIRNFLYPND